MRGQHRRAHRAGAAFLALCAACAPAPADLATGLVFPAPVVDLGTLMSGREEIVRFPFEVRGDQPVSVSALLPGCGCLEPYLVRDGVRLPLGAPLAPGSRGEIVVAFRTAGYVGRKDTPLRVEGSGPGLPVELEIRSLLEPWLVVEPARWTPGPLDGEGPWEVEFRVRGPEPHRLLEPAGLPAGVAVEGLPSARAAREHRFRVVIGAGAAPGPQAWFLLLRADNGVSTVIPVDYRIEEEVWTRPERVIRLGEVPAGGEVAATVDVGVRHGELSVTAYRLEGLPGGTVECLELTPSRSYRLRLRLPIEVGASGVLAGKLHLELRHLVGGVSEDLSRQLTLAGVVK